MFDDAADASLSPVAPSSPECTRQKPQRESAEAPDKAVLHRNEVEELVIEKRRYAITCLAPHVSLTSQRLVSWT